MNNWGKKGMEGDAAASAREERNEKSEGEKKKKKKEKKKICGRQAEYALLLATAPARPAVT